MFNFIKTALKLNNDQRGVTALEYALVAATICTVALTGYTSVSTKLTSVLTSVTNAI